MPRLPRIAGIAGCLLLSALVCRADEANRLLVTVTKKTTGRSAAKTAPGDEPGRVQTLLVSVTNQSIRAMPAGVIQWTAVVRKSSGDLLKYSGKGDLPPLVSFKSVEIPCGSFEVEGRLGSTGIERDRVNYEIAIFHGGKESYRTVSVSNFAVLAEKAQAVSKEGKEGEDTTKVAKKEDAPAPKPAKDAKPPEPAIVGAEKMPPQKGAAPVAEIAKPVAEPPPVPQQTFDFFNLHGKTVPAVK